MVGFDLAVGNHVRAGWRVFQKRHLSADRFVLSFETEFNHGSACYGRFENSHLARGKATRTEKRQWNPIRRGAILCLQSKFCQNEGFCTVEAITEPAPINSRSRRDRFVATER
jgi:hypothetical protein